MLTSAQVNPVGSQAEHRDTESEGSRAVSTEPALSPKESAESVLRALGLRRGQLIGGKYQIEDAVGTGATSVVVAATNVSIRRRVALKLLLQPHRAPRFKREAQTSARIDSDHLVRVLDDGVHQGVCYMVMDLLQGEDLRAVLRRRGRLPVCEVATYIIQVCEPLAVAHALGIVHRDIKPENLFLARGRLGAQVLKLLDFGHAKATLEEVQLTDGADPVGTLPYMSPEQYLQPRHVDPRADLWALGVVIHELIAGRRPFSTEGETVWQEADRIRNAEPIPLREVCPDLPAEVEELVLDLLQKDRAERERRVPGAAAVAERLSPFAAAHAQAMVPHIEAAAAALAERSTEVTNAPPINEAVSTVSADPGTTPGAMATVSEPSEGTPGHDRLKPSGPVSSARPALPSPPLVGRGRLVAGLVAGGAVLIIGAMQREFRADAPVGDIAAALSQASAFAAATEVPTSPGTVAEPSVSAAARSSAAPGAMDQRSQPSPARDKPGPTPQKARPQSVQPAPSLTAAESSPPPAESSAAPPAAGAESVSPGSSAAPEPSDLRSKLKEELKTPGKQR